MIRFCRGRGSARVHCEADVASPARGVSRRILQGELLAALLLCQSREAFGAASTNDDYNIVQDEPLDLTVTDKVCNSHRVLPSQVSSFEQL